MTADSYSTGTISSDTVYGDFTLLATSKKNVKISSSSATYGSTSYKNAWDLQGGADGVKPSYRAFKVTLAKGDILKAVVNANASRTLQLSNGSKVVSSASVGTSASLFSYNATSQEPIIFIQNQVQYAFLKSLRQVHLLLVLQAVLLLAKVQVLQADLLQAFQFQLLKHKQVLEHAQDLTKFLL